VHALPTTRTMNAARAPTLIYSSAHAHPFPLVQANVALPTGAAWPDSAVGILSVNGVEKARTRFGGDGWIPGRASRIALGYDALNDATGVYPYKVKVVNWYGTTQLADSASGDLVVVNRKASPFGAGSWVAGVEQLNPATMVWTGGDGSVRKYLPTGTANVWAAVTIDRPDTLKYVTNWAVRDPGSGATSTVSAYVRSLPHGVKVAFDASGRHFETRTRLGHTTRFSYDASNRLSRIRLPIANDAAGPTYDFAYTTGALQTVTCT
jgi:YD repeat-containing protein